MAQEKLNDKLKAFIVQSLACFDPPSAVVAAVKAEFKVDVRPQSVEAYDPNKRAGRKLSERWREIFKATREEFLRDTSRIGISHRAVRLRALERMAARAEEMRNLDLAARLLEQAAKEVGDSYTNRQKLDHNHFRGINLSISSEDAEL